MPSDRRSELFALGALLYELPTGCRQCDGPGDLETTVELLPQITPGRPPAHRAHNDSEGFRAVAAPRELPEIE
jgi:hypothetical protein